MNAGGVNIINTAANWAGWAVSSITAKFQQVSTKGKGEAGSETAVTPKPTGKLDFRRYLFLIYIFNILVSNPAIFYLEQGS